MAPPSKTKRVSISAQSVDHTARLAGISTRDLRYRMVTSFAFSRRADLDASIAVFPPPITVTDLSLSSGGFPSVIILRKSVPSNTPSSHGKGSPT